jgi:triphosphoribosyl-dephospho-CoA synthase
MLMPFFTVLTGQALETEPDFSPGRLAQLACILEVTARKPGNVHRFADLPDLDFVDFLVSAAAIVAPLDRAAVDGIGRSVYASIAATRRVVGTNTNLGIVLLLAPLAAAAGYDDLAEGVEAVLAATTVEDARQVYRAIRRAEPGGMDDVADQDIANEPSLPLRTVMGLARERDSIALQYANGFREVFSEALPELRRSLQAGRPLETAIIATYLKVLAWRPDSLITRKRGVAPAIEVSRRAAELLESGWPDGAAAQERLATFDSWLRHPDNRFNPGTSADLVTAALYVALREGTIALPTARGFAE